MRHDSYVRINGRASVRSADDRWELALYGRNLHAATTYSFMSDAPGSAGIFAAWLEEPRVWGLQLRLRL